MKKTLSLLIITILMVSLVITWGTSVNAGSSSIPKKATIVSVKNSSKGSAKITWKKDSNVSGYQVFMAKAVVDEIHMKTTVDNLALRKKPTTKSKKLKSIPKGTILYTGLSEPIKADGYTWYYVFYNVSDGYVEGYVASEYLTTVYKAGDYTKIKTISDKDKTSYTKSKLTKGKKYYFKVRSYKTVDGEKVYGHKSTCKSVTIKK